jgi:hypothetical protein
MGVQDLERVNGSHNGEPMRKLADWSAAISFTPPGWTTM